MPRTAPSATDDFGLPLPADPSEDIDAYLASLPDPPLAQVTQLRPLALARTYASLCEILRNSEYADRVLDGRTLEYDSMAEQPTIDRVPMRDADVLQLRERIERQLTAADGSGLRFGKQDIWDAVLQIASERDYHPVVEWLRSLEWDGVDRLSSLAEDALGVGDELSLTLLRRWMIGAVARPLDPGCKLDTALIFVGEEEKQKSMFFDVIGGRWFADTPIDLRNKQDTGMAVAACWILEFAELESMTRRESSTVKAFLSSRHDDFRAPYGRSIIRHARASIIVGTTNEDDFVQDPRGARRYWPIPISSSINIDYVIAQRDQLCAEAVALYDAAASCPACRPRRCALHAWWLTETESAALRIRRGEYEREDTWSSRVSSYVGSMTTATTSEILEHAIKKDVGQWTRADEMRIAKILRDLNFVRVRKMLEGERKYFFERRGK